MPLDPAQVRASFPALASGATFFDNPGGTQVPRQVSDRITRYLTTTNANHGGAFPTSVASDAVTEANKAQAEASARLLLAPGCSIDPSTQPANLHAMVEAAV